MGGRLLWRWHACVRPRSLLSFSITVSDGWDSIDPAGATWLLVGVPEVSAGTVTSGMRHLRPYPHVVLIDSRGHGRGTRDACSARETAIAGTVLPPDNGRDWPSPAATLLSLPGPPEDAAACDRRGMPALVIQVIGWRCRGFARRPLASAIARCVAARTGWIATTRRASARCRRATGPGNQPLSDRLLGGPAPVGLPWAVAVGAGVRRGW